jgi:hypothetical protein
MAVNNSRRMNADLDEGMSDGSYKKIATRERGGVVEDVNQRARKDLFPHYYDEVEASVKLLPDGTYGV